MRIFYVFVALLFISCSKTNKLEETSCMPIEAYKPIPPYNLRGMGYKYVPLLNINCTYPCLNPLNENEFAYIRQLNSNIELCVYNRSSKSNISILQLKNKKYEGIPASYVRWSKKNWLLFEDLYNNIFKIKPNGDSLTQLTFSRSDFNPEWNNKGTLFCTEHLTFDKKYITIIRDEKGDALDTIQYGNIQTISGIPSWNNDRYIFGSNYDGFLLIDYMFKNVIQIPTNIKDAGEPYWINENEIIYSNHIEGIYTFNIKNYTTKKLRQISNANQYSFISLLPNNNFLCERNYFELIDSINGIIAYKTTICIINPCDTVITDFDLK